MNNNQSHALACLEYLKKLALAYVNNSSDLGDEEDVENNYAHVKAILRNNMKYKIECTGPCGYTITRLADNTTIFLQGDDAITFSKNLDATTATFTDDDVCATYDDLFKTPHFGYYEVDDGCCINFYHYDESGTMRRETLTTIKDIVLAEELITNLNNILPLIRK